MTGPKVSSTWFVPLGWAVSRNGVARTFPALKNKQPVKMPMKVLTFTRLSNVEVIHHETGAHFTKTTLPSQFS
jgi:hypothetical protein